MKNPYEHLRTSPGYDYPVLKDFENIAIYNDGVEYITIHVGVQDGFWVVGASYKIGTAGGGCYPGRKWGQFDSRDNAILWKLGAILGIDSINMPGNIRKAIVLKIDEIRQLSLF